MSQEKSALQPTLLSTIQTFGALDKLPDHAPHPFASSAEPSCSLLQNLVNSTEQILHSLQAYSATPISDPKLVSILRQHVGISQSLHISGQTISQCIDSLRKRSDACYGEDIPLQRVLIVDWCISRIKTWSASVGMETFPDEEREGRMTMVLGGKVVVVDIDFAIDRSDPLAPTIDVTGTKTSYAVPNGPSASAMNGSILLDDLLARNVRSFCDEIQKGEEIRQPRVAAQRAKVVIEHLSYLMMLDKLAMQEGDKGIRWFVDMLELGSKIDQFAKLEATSVASSLSTARSPLDIYLLRSHAFPIPYLNSPSVSFLVHLSPLAYLTLLRTSPPAPKSNGDQSPFDIPAAHIRQQLSGLPRISGVTVADLFLCQVSDPPLYSSPLSTLSNRPSFPLVPETPGIDHIFPQIAEIEEQVNGEHVGRYAWILDFTEQGNHGGVVMSQSRMRDIEFIVNPLSVMSAMNPGGMMPFSSRSWVDLLLNPKGTVPLQRYTTLYCSPTSKHPPLRLGLVAPDEPGFLLERIRVNSIKEVWGILEVVREQCWLNEILNGCRWSVDDANPSEDDMADVGEDAIGELLSALLSYNLMPRKIPVSITLPSHDPPDALFDSPSLGSMSLDQMHSQRPRIVMTSPERPPLSGMVEITVTYDETRSQGARVDIRGALGTDVNVELLEEVCRRGGTLGLSGRVWAKGNEI